MIKKILYLFVLISIVAITGVASIFLYVSWNLPKLTKLSDYNPPIPTKIFSADGEILAELKLQKRELVEITEVPKVIIDAFTSAEDSNFFQHSGVDYLGIMRAMIANIKAGRIVQGGSTITQQVAKSILLSSERSFVRKIKDFLLAIKIEKHFSKHEILHLYLNQVYLGGGFYGVKTAFKGYFDKSLNEVNVAESAMVAGLLVAPGKYSPYLNPGRAKIRQEYVLGRMFANGKISDQEYKEALTVKLKFMLRKSRKFKAAYFTDWIIQKLIKRFGKDSLLTDGYTIKTTIDFKLQRKAEESVRQGLRNIDKRQGFSTPVKQIDLSELPDFDYKSRVTFLKNKSSFFKLDDLEKNKHYEFTVNDDFLMQLSVENSQFVKQVRNRHFLKGNDLHLDQVYTLLKKGTFHNATVLKVDRSLQIIYVSVMGLKGIIPYKYFRWAHKRLISGERQYFPYVKDPNKIVQSGDQILVKVVNKKSTIKSNMSRKFLPYFEKINSVKRELISKQSFLLLSLEQKPIVQGGLVSIDPFSGEIKALVGGYSFDDSKYNRALQAKRQPGSAFKPLLYAAALENGYTAASILIDSPEALQGMSDGLSWKPRNYDGKFKGPITFRRSLEHSRNVPTIKIASDIGIKNILEFLKRIKFKANIVADLSMSLGTFGVTLKDIVKIYSIFPNGGKVLNEKSIISITDRNNNHFEIEDEVADAIVPESQSEVESHKGIKSEQSQTSEINIKKNSSSIQIEQVKPNPFLMTLSETQVYDPRLSYLMVNLLRGVVKNGTGRRAKSISPYIGGKTGTTNNYLDAWFIGFSSKLVTGVWTGEDDNTTMGWGETGSKAALPIWKSFMKYSIDLLGESDFRAPDGIINILINKKSGRLASKADGSTIMESFVEGTEPGTRDESFQSLMKESSNSVDDELYYED